MKTAAAEIGATHELQLQLNTAFHRNVELQIDMQTRLCSLEKQQQEIYQMLQELLGEMEYFELLHQ